MSRHHGTDDRDHLQVARFEPLTEALGPGRRAFLMVQGCELRCHGCLVPGTHALEGGQRQSVVEIAERILAGPEIDGITFSGGEPMLQAGALARLIDILRTEWPQLSTMSYTGYRLERLLRHGSESQWRLLERLDLLIDGPYVERLHRRLKWRGSSNQRVLFLTDRHVGDIGDDLPVPMEVTTDGKGGVSFIGVPPLPGILSRIELKTV